MRGALPAAFLAWMLTGWASRRLEPSGVASGLAAAGGILCVLGIVPAALLGLPFGRPVDETAAPFWYGLVYLGAGPAVLSGLAAAVVMAGAVVYRPRRWLRRMATWPGALRRRPSALGALIVAVTVLIGLGLYRVDALRPDAGSCAPSVPAGVEDPPGARLSYLSRVFISPRATEDQRNLAQAAIGRGYGGGYTFHGDPRSPGFTDAYCARGRLPAEATAALPWFWTVDLYSPGLFGGLRTRSPGCPAWWPCSTSRCPEGP